VSEHFTRLAQLERERRSFAMATVVARRAPVSSHLGDRALVFSDGTMEGFIGGSCSREIVRREALRALRAGLPRLVQIRPDAAPDAQSGRECVVVAMGCASEGAVDVYIEPHLPLPRLIVAGDTPVADALARLAAQIGYDVVRVVLAAETEAMEAIAGARVVALEGLGELMLRQAQHDKTVAVVASQGHYDEAALGPLLAAELAYVGLLASRRRARAILDALATEGIAPERLARVHAPAGLAIGARTPGDVAISILAEIVSVTAPTTESVPDEHLMTSAHGVMPSLSKHASRPPEADTAVDPMCGMDVAIVGARHTLDLDGTRRFFCSAHCRDAYSARRSHPVPTAGNA
jgi:xanthine dehydrogenase accessory factor